MRNYFRELAHLHEQIGDERFQALVSSDNTGKVKIFCDNLIGVTGGLPVEITIGDRTYEIVRFDWGRKYDPDVSMQERAMDMNAFLGEEDGQYLLEYQDEIPAVLRNKFAFVFLNWHKTYDSRWAAMVYWRDDHWIQNWTGYEQGWFGYYRLLRRKLQSIKPTLPTEMTVGGRTYEILNFLQEGEERVNGYTMTARAKEKGAHIGQEEGEHILRHQDEIPAALQGKVVFVFTDWGHPRISERISYVHWNAEQCHWVEFWDLLSSGHWNSRYQVLRRKQ